MNYSSTHISDKQPDIFIDTLTGIVYSGVYYLDIYVVVRTLLIMEMQDVVYTGIEDMDSVLPIYDSGTISLKRLSYFMGTTQESIARIIGRDVRTVQRDSASSTVRKILQPLVHALQMLSELTNNNQNEIQRWLHEPRPEWKGKSPIDCLEAGNTDAVVNLVSRIYYGDSTGY